MKLSLITTLLCKAFAEEPIESESRTRSSCDPNSHNAILARVSKGVPNLAITGGWSTYTLSGSHNTNIYAHEGWSKWNLGRYSHTSGTISYYFNGESCNGKPRQAYIIWTCGDQDGKIWKGSELRTCEYEFRGHLKCCTDPCATNRGGCGPNSVCSNNAGNAVCTANTGFTNAPGSSKLFIDIDECASTGTNNCHADATCTNTVGSFTCECNQEYNGDGLTCAPYDGPCPSQTCWTFDAGTSACLLKSGCTDVECGATSIKMFFNKWMLNSALTMSNGITGLSPSGAVDNTLGTHQDMDYVLECDLGSCDMGYSITGGQLVLTVDIAQDGDDRLRDAQNDNKLFTGSVNVITAPHGVSVTFQCSYDTTVTLDSNEFDIEDVSILGDTVGNGDLTSGFSIALASGNINGKFILGDLQRVHITWSVTTFADVKFLIDECKVYDASKTVSIVKGDCYSTVVKATRLTQAAGVTNKQSLEYKTFKFEGTSGTGMSVQCSIRICTDCNHPGTCPSTGDDSMLDYSVNGFNGPKLNTD